MSVTKPTKMGMHQPVTSEKSVDDIKSALERDNFMTPDSAKDFGLVDKVVSKRE